MTVIARRAVFAAMITLGSWLGSPATQAEGARKFVVTEPVHNFDSLPIYLGIRKGFFEKAGIDLQIVTAEGGGRHISAVLSGDADGFIGGPEHMAFAKVKGGQELRAVAGISNRANSFFVARLGVPIDPKAPIAANLKGRRIVVGTRGGTGYSILMMMLNDAKLDPRSDVEVIEIAAAAGRLAAMKAGQGDIAILQEPLITQGQKAGVTTDVFYNLPKELGPFAWTTLNLPLKLIDGDPALVGRVVSAVQQSLEYTFAHPDEAAKIAKLEFPTLPDDDQAAIIRSTFDNNLWQRDGAMPKEAWALTETVVRSAGLLSRDVGYDEIFEPKFLKK